MDLPRDESCPRWIRALDAEGRIQVDSRRVRYFRNGRTPFPLYVVPIEDVDAGARGLLRPAEVAGHLVLDFRKFDTVLEEDEVVIVHPRDPYHRVDAMPSRRVVEVKLGDELLARSEHPVSLFETGLPTRYYLPLTDLRRDLLVRSDRTTGCPYKGVAGYWHLDIGGTRYENFVWHYDHPFPAVDAIRGRAAFYNEKVDLVVDGEPLARPTTVFS